MKSETFHFEVRDCVNQFVAAFNDVVITRFNNGRSEGDKIHAQFTYAPKQRVLHDLVNKSKHIRRKYNLRKSLSGGAQQALEDKEDVFDDLASIETALKEYKLNETDQTLMDEKKIFDSVWTVDINGTETELTELTKLKLTKMEFRV